MMHPKRLDILGVPIDAVTEEHVLQCVSTTILQNTRLRILAVNPEKVMRALREQGLPEALESSEILIPDGIGAVLALRWLHDIRVPRLPGADLMLTLCKKAEEEGLSVFLLGATEETNRRADAELRKRYPKLMIVGRANGYSDMADPKRLFSRLQELKPHFLFVALGSPFQEKWIHANFVHLCANVIQGVGGTFDVIAGTVRRAPPAWQRWGLEWLHRLVEQPSRIKRQYVLPIFFIRVLTSRFIRLKV